MLEDIISELSIREKVGFDKETGRKEILFLNPEPVSGGSGNVPMVGLRDNSDHNWMVNNMRQGIKEFFELRSIVGNTEKS